MADIDYTILTDNGFEVSLGDVPTKATGNKLLSNRFTITFLTTIRQYLMGKTIVTDTYGGDALRYVGQPQALNNPQSIASTISIAMNKTIDSIKASQATVVDPTEQLAGATLVNVSVEVDRVYATIQIFPVAYSSPNELYFTIPVMGILLCQILLTFMR
jgi:hypothetical protein